MYVKCRLIWLFSGLSLEDWMNIVWVKTPRLLLLLGEPGACVGPWPALRLPGLPPGQGVGLEWASPGLKPRLKVSRVASLKVPGAQHWVDVESVVCTGLVVQQSRGDGVSPGLSRVGVITGSLEVIITRIRYQDIRHGLTVVHRVYFHVDMVCWWSDGSKLVFIPIICTVRLDRYHVGLLSISKCGAINCWVGPYRRDH